MLAETIDDVLGEVASNGIRGAAADALLDLRDAVLARRDAGDCLGCYFKILGYYGERSPGRVTPLRQWLEAHLELVARVPGVGELERIPLRLESEDLEGFCVGMMNRIREERSYPYSMIELCVGFRDPLHAA